MSWGTAYQNSCPDNRSNNAFFSQPAMMGDGRMFTAYTSSAETDEVIKRFEKIQTNWSYRQYLQNHANEIRKYNNAECFYELGLNPNTEIVSGSNTPKLYNSVHDATQPKVGYCNSDLKNYYLSRTQLNAKMVSPVINMNT